LLISKKKLKIPLLLSTHEIKARKDASIFYPKIDRDYEYDFAWLKICFLYWFLEGISQVARTDQTFPVSQ
jgi:hypothetical protein